MFLKPVFKIWASTNDGRDLIFHTLTCGVNNSLGKLNKASPAHIISRTVKTMQTKLKQGALNLLPWTNVNSSSPNGSSLIVITSQNTFWYIEQIFFLGEGELDRVLIRILAYCAKMIIYFCLITVVLNLIRTPVTIKFLRLCNVYSGTSTRFKPIQHFYLSPLSSKGYVHVCISCLDTKLLNI